MRIEEEAIDIQTERSGEEWHRETEQEKEEEQ